MEDVMIYIHVATATKMVSFIKKSNFMDIGCDDNNHTVGKSTRDHSDSSYKARDWIWIRSSTTGVTHWPDAGPVSV